MIVELGESQPRVPGKVLTSIGCIISLTCGSKHGYVDFSFSYICYLPKKTLLEEKAVIAKLGESQLSYSLTGTFKMRTAVTESCDSRAW